MGAVDAGVAAEVVADPAGDGEEDGVLGAEEFDAHERAGKRGVTGAGEDGDEAEAGGEINGQAEEAGERGAERAADEEERGDLAAFETHAQGDGGEEEFPEPAPGVGAARLENGEGGHVAGEGTPDAETEVFAGAEGVNEGDDDDAADERA